MKSKDELGIWARARIHAATSPAQLSADGDAFMVYGTIGSCGFVTGNGDIYLEQDDFDPPGSFVQDSSRAAQIQALVLGSRRFPELAAWLPKRDDASADCETCRGTGWVPVATTSILCQACSGLGFDQPTGAE